MKKLLFLTAILFMAPITDGMTVSLNDTGTTIELSVFGYGSPDYICGIAMVIESPGLLTNFVEGPEAPTSLKGPVTINGDSGEYRLFVPLNPFVDGVWLIADWSASVPVRVSAYEGMPREDWILLDRIQVPEPTTIAMLALGGILLLRNRHSGRTCRLPIIRLFGK